MRHLFVLCCVVLCCFVVFKLPLPEGNANLVLTFLFKASHLEAIGQLLEVGSHLLPREFHGSKLSQL